ncbi:MAG: hypothetical protein JWM88_1879 [Verrucomicrobia bacterium]|nr:hypothetical protein [Verrucomicrobiota bacterium]
MNTGYIYRLVVGAWLGTALLQAQPVFESSPAAPVVPASLRDIAQSSVFSLGMGGVETPALLHWGPLELTPHASDKFVYSDGILVRPGRATNTYINSFSVGFVASLGRNWTMDYTPTWMVYTNRAFQNSVEQHLSIAGGAEIRDWLAQISQSYVKTNTPRIETGRQTSQQISDTHLSVSHRFTDHLSLELNGSQSLQFIDQSPDYYDWSTQDWLTYRFVSRLDFSIGYRIGYTDFDPGAHMTYSEPSARVRWRIADKLTLSVQAGREHRQIKKNGIPAQDTPTFDGTVQYQPFERTMITLRAQRSVSPSYFTNSVTENKGWSADLQQRLLGRLTLLAGFGGQKSHFSGSHTEFIPTFSTVDIVNASGVVIGQLTTVSFHPTTVIDLRNDSTQSFHARLSTPFARRGTFSVLYNRTRNSSDQPGFNFTSHQVGCEIEYHF